MTERSRLPEPALARRLLPVEDQPKRAGKIERRLAARA
jgi:hypothetical protein